jgi:uncharacterized membrane protein YhaH (DUF805 family)
MSFWQWLFSFKGRIKRARWWAAALVYAAASVIAAAAIWLFILIAAVQLDSEDEASLLGSTLAGFLLIALTVSGLAVTVKRFHDRGKSGWWVVPALALLAFGAMIAISSGNPSDPDILGVFIMLAALVWMVVDLGVLSGNAGANRFGDEPKS